MKKNWYDNIFIWFCGIAIFALLTHIIFKIPAPFPWLEAVWGAGDLLTFVGTAFLGVLALYQNQRFKDENEKSNRKISKMNEELLKLQVANYSSFVDLIKGHQETRSKEHDNHAFTTHTASIIFLEESNNIKLSANFPTNEHYRYHIDCVFRNNSDFQITAVQASCLFENAPNTIIVKKEIYVGRNQEFMLRFNLPIALDKERMTKLIIKFINCYGFGTDYIVKISNTYDVNNKNHLNKIDYKLATAAPSINFKEETPNE